MQNQKLTKEVIGCAYKVYNRMGCGFLEAVYEKCMLIELGRAGLRAEAQIPIDVYYDSEIVGTFCADVLVENRIIVELKSVSTLVKAHEVQLVNYLTATGKEIGLLINFGKTKVEVKRKIRQLPRSDWLL